MNLDDMSTTHKTAVGGVFTLLIYVFIFCFVVQKTSRIVTNRNPDFYTVTELDTDPLGTEADHDYSEMRAFNLHTLTKQLEGPLWLNRTDLDQYLNIYFYEETADWTEWERRHSLQDVISRRVHKAVQCTQDHFGHSLRGLQLA